MPCCFPLEGSKGASKFDGKDESKKNKSKTNNDIGVSSSKKLKKFNVFAPFQLPILEKGPKKKPARDSQQAPAALVMSNPFW